jgi:hypothetical protein
LFQLILRSLFTITCSYNVIPRAMGSWDSSVGIATGYGLDDQGEWEFESR